MQRLTENKIILIKRKTRLEELIARYNTIEQARFYIEHLGADFSDYLLEDRIYKEVISKATSTLESLGRLQVVSREFVPHFIFGETDTVVVVGQDGLVANTLKYLSSQPVIGVNPDAKRWDGILLPFQVAELRPIIIEVFKRQRSIKEVTMAKATLNDGQVMYGVNDLFIGQKTHVSSRYTIGLGKYEEQQSSSGIIISTGLGATGWLKSILKGAAGITSCYTKNKVDFPNKNKTDWGAEFLYFSVREPFPSRNTKTEIVFGNITRQQPLTLLSHMPENGVIFSDGIEQDYLEFNSGIEARITVADKKGHLVV